MGRIYIVKKIPFVVLLIFIIITLVLIFTPNFAPIKLTTSLVQTIFSTPRSIVYAAKTARSDNLDYQSLKNENEKLKKKISEYEKMAKDNAALRSQFETTQTHDYKLLPARILGFEGGLFSPTSIVIDRGSSDGLKKDMGVIYQNNLIGKM